MDTEIIALTHYEKDVSLNPAVLDGIQKLSKSTFDGCFTKQDDGNYLTATQNVLLMLSSDKKAVEVIVVSKNSMKNLSVQSQLYEKWKDFGQPLGKALLWL